MYNNDKIFESVSGYPETILHNCKIKIFNWI